MRDDSRLLLLVVPEIGIVLLLLLLKVLFLLLVQTMLLLNLLLQPAVFLLDLNTKLHLHVDLLAKLLALHLLGNHAVPVALYLPELVADILLEVRYLVLLFEDSFPKLLALII